MIMNIKDVLDNYVEKVLIDYLKKKNFNKAYIDHVISSDDKYAIWAYLKFDGKL